MSLLPHEATFHERVQDCFLAFRGSGLMLSPLDLELLDQWVASEVPFEVVARGIRHAAESALWDSRPGEGLRSLRACRRAVDAEIRKYTGKAAGKTASAEAPTTPELPAPLRRHKKLRAAVKKLGAEMPELASATGRLLSGSLASEPVDLAQSARHEELVYVALIRALPWVDRSHLLREAAVLAQNAPAVSARARKVARRFHRAAVLKRRLSLPSFW